MKPTIYWIESGDDVRLAILARPRSGDWLESEIQGWREAGIDLVVSMLTEAENIELGLVAEAELCGHNEIQFISFPVEDLSVPNSMDQTIEFVRSLNELLSQGKKIGFHCRGCLGRAPLIASCLLMFSGQTATKAFELVSVARGYQVPETAEQAGWGRKFASSISSLAH